MIEKFDVWFAPAGEKRKIHLYLPDDYYETDERYATLYMFDGHNLFYDGDATYGTCLGLKEFLDGYRKKLIVVGMEPCLNDYIRVHEYAPYDLHSRQYGLVRGRADATLSWIVDDLKSYIDSHYRTHYFREATSIAGYSMGGLTALYGVLRYNRYFSKAAIISPSIIIAKTEFMWELESHSYSPDTRIFFSWGTNEYDPQTNWIMSQDILQIEKKAQEKGIKTYILCQQGGEHNEASWREQTETWMNFHWF